MLYKLVLFLSLFYSSLALAKYQVCSITINSPDEIETFKQFLSPKDFEFVELLPAKVNPAQDHSSDWFNSACKKDYRCDILVISGHFGGTFFGDSSYSLPTEQLEAKACKNSCKGILSHVKEIFLFGCNTLASKQKDSRSYEEYLKVLLDDGMARETAERVVAARYSPLETPFRARMNFIFSGSNTIYGFDELSPLGKHIRRPLENYFRSINRTFGSYANYLHTKQYTRDRNTELFRNLPRNRFTLNQDHISLENESPEKRKFFNDKCLLYDSTEHFSRRIQALKDIFETRQSGSAFFAIDHFLNSNKTQVIEGQGREIFRSIRKNKSLRKEFISYYKDLNFLPYIKLVYLNVRERFQWIDPVRLHIHRKQALLELIKKPDMESYTSIILLLSENQIRPNQFYISKSDLPDNYIRNFWSLLIFQHLKVQAPEWQADMLQYCKDHIKEDPPTTCSQVLNTLAHIHPEIKTAREAFPFLNSDYKGLILFTIRMLGQSGVEDYHIHEKISSFLTHSAPDIREEALEALGYLKTPYTDIQEDITDLLPYADEQLSEDIFWSLGHMNVQSASAQKRIIRYVLKTDNEEMAKKAFTALQNTSDFSNFSLSFFYSQLESRDNLEFLLLLVEVLSQNKKLRDLGIHYRFLQFYKDADELKEKILEKMSPLSWMHPNVQVNFVRNYILDQNPKVRRLAVHVLKNITNLQPETLDKIKTLYKETNIEELKEFF